MRGWPPGKPHRPVGGGVPCERPRCNSALFIVRPSSCWSCVHVFAPRASGSASHMSALVRPPQRPGRRAGEGRRTIMPLRACAAKALAPRSRTTVPWHIALLRASITRAASYTGSSASRHVAPLAPPTLRPSRFPGWRCSLAGDVSDELNPGIHPLRASQRANTPPKAETWSRAVALGCLAAIRCVWWPSKLPSEVGRGSGLLGGVGQGQTRRGWNEAPSASLQPEMVSTARRGGGADRQTGAPLSPPTVAARRRSPPHGRRPA